MKKETLEILREGDDLWRWAEKNEPQPAEPGWLRKLLRRLFRRG
jgi:hypothetical protein